MSIQLDTVSITGAQLQINNKNIPIERMGWIEFLNESLYTLQLQMGSININIPAWYDYPIQIQKLVQGVYQNTSGASLPIKIAPMLLPASTTAQSSSLLTTVYNIGETPAITTPQPLVRQTFIPNSVGTQVTTLSNNTGSTAAIVINIGLNSNNYIIINTDGSATWGVLQGGVLHSIFSINTSGTPLQLGSANDFTEILGTLFIDSHFKTDGQLIATDGLGNMMFSSNKAVQWKDSGGTVRNVLLLDTGDNASLLQTASGHPITFKDQNGTTICTMDANGIHLSEGSISFNGTGSIAQTGIFSGTGNATVFTGVTNPGVVTFDPCTVNGSTQTIGGTVASSSVVTTGAGLAWKGLAIG